MYEINIKYSHRKSLLQHYNKSYINYDANKALIEQHVIAKNKKIKRTDELCVMLNNDVTLEDIQIFDKASRSIMGLLRNSYIEFCKTKVLNICICVIYKHSMYKNIKKKEYAAFASAYKGDEKIDIFTALRGTENIHCNIFFCCSLC